MSASGWRAGYRLLAARAATLPGIVHDALAATSHPEIDGAGLRRVVATGVGSSAAHARYLASVLNEIGLPAEWRPLGSFLAAPRGEASRDVLVVFSQGLSPNAELALAHAARYREAWLATAVGEAPADAPVALPAAAAAGRDATARRAAQQAQLARHVARGVRVLGFPGADEYATLLRLVGPIAGYAAALRFARAAARAVGLDFGAAYDPADVARHVGEAAARADTELADLGADELERGLTLVASGRHVERIDNLRFKVLEGTFLPLPPAWDLLEMAHGPFQQLVAAPAAILALTRPDAPREAELLARLESMLDPARHRVFRLAAKLGGPFAVFEHEALLNALVLRFVAARQVDQLEWPGRGRDAPLYDVTGEAGAAAGSAAGGAISSSRERPTSAAPSAARLEGATWRDVEAWLAAGRRTAVLGLGSTEQHGPHLPLATDTWIAAALGARLCARLDDAVLLPSLGLGCAAEHLDFAGTLSLEDDTLAAVLRDVGASLVRHGFARLFVFSAHGGNARALAAALPSLRAACAPLQIAIAADLARLSATFHAASAQHDVSAAASGQHAGEYETSIMRALRPETVRTDRLAAGLVDTEQSPDELFYPSLRRHAPDGTVGDPRGADAARTEAYLDAWVERLEQAYRSASIWAETNGA